MRSTQLLNERDKKAISSYYDVYNEFKVRSDIAKYEASLLRNYSQMHHTLKNIMFAKQLANDFKEQLDGSETFCSEGKEDDSAWVFNGTNTVNNGAVKVSITNKSNLKVKFKLCDGDVVLYKQKNLRIPTPFEYNFNDCYEIVAEVIRLAFIEKGLISESAKLTVTVS